MCACSNVFTIFPRVDGPDIARLLKYSIEKPSFQILFNGLCKKCNITFATTPLKDKVENMNYGYTHAGVEGKPSRKSKTMYFNGVIQSSMTCRRSHVMLRSIDECAVALLINLH